MIRLSQKAFSCLALSVFMTMPVQAGQDSAGYKVDARKFKVVKQADGSEVIRLAARNNGQSPANSTRATSTRAAHQEPWQDIAVEPRLMTALATLPGMLRVEGQNLPEAVDPSLVRSWAEFIDPSLALRWKTYLQINGFSEALLRRAEEGAKGQLMGSATGLPSKAPWVNTAVGTTWRNVVSEGAKHALMGQQALHEWLMLPMPEPRSNPWLSNLGSYRY